ncbi:unnamed protein product, partial [Prorocentrum cordatum]
EGRCAQGSFLARAPGGLRLPPPRRFLFTYAAVFYLLGYELLWATAAGGEATGAKITASRTEESESVAPQRALDLAFICLREALQRPGAAPVAAGPPGAPAQLSAARPRLAARTDPKRPAKVAKVRTARELLQLKPGADRSAMERQFRRLATPHRPDRARHRPLSASDRADASPLWPRFCDAKSLLLGAIGQLVQRKRFALSAPVVRALLVRPRARLGSTSKWRDAPLAPGDGARVPHTFSDRAPRRQSDSQDAPPVASPRGSRRAPPPRGARASTRSAGPAARVAAAPPPRGSGSDPACDLASGARDPPAVTGSASSGSLPVMLGTSEETGEGAGELAKRMQTLLAELERRKDAMRIARSRLADCVREAASAGFPEAAACSPSPVAAPTALAEVDSAAEAEARVGTGLHSEAEPARHRDESATLAWAPGGLRLPPPRRFLFTYAAVFYLLGYELLWATAAGSFALAFGTPAPFRVGAAVTDACRAHRATAEQSQSRLADSRQLPAPQRALDLAFICQREALQRPGAAPVAAGPPGAPAQLSAARPRLAARTDPKRPAKVAKVRTARELLQLKPGADRSAMERQFRRLATPHRPDRARHRPLSASDRADASPLWSRFCDAKSLLLGAPGAPSSSARLGSTSKWRDAPLAPGDGARVPHTFSDRAPRRQSDSQDAPPVASPRGSRRAPPPRGARASTRSAGPAARFAAAPPPRGSGSDPACDLASGARDPPTVTGSASSGSLPVGAFSARGARSLGPAAAPRAALLSVDSPVDSADLPQPSGAAHEKGSDALVMLGTGEETGESAGELAKRMQTLLAELERRKDAMRIARSRLADCVREAASAGFPEAAAYSPSPVAAPTALAEVDSAAEAEARVGTGLHSEAGLRRCYGHLAVQMASLDE